MQGIAYAFFITPNNNFIMSVADPGKQSISSSVFNLSTNLGQMSGIILMEFLFAFAMPAGFSPDGTHAALVTPGNIAAGFSWAYAGGAGLCLVALILSATMQDRKIGIASADSEATLL
jgi:hypothetical protein